MYPAAGLTAAAVVQWLYSIGTSWPHRATKLYGNAKFHAAAMDTVLCAVSGRSIPVQGRPPNPLYKISNAEFHCY
jgi:hypothetical protein